ncbi:hypothetical protein BDW22DRAFT_568326 [Trametopsis cervina]|nr:hypothetical protein BDW22DRAFT_568326 [Trametopsis cervina]
MCYRRCRRPQAVEDIERGSNTCRFRPDHASQSERNPGPSGAFFKLTPYRVLNLALLFSLGVWKAVASYRNEAFVSSTLDTFLTLGVPIIMFLVGLPSDTCPSSPEKQKLDLT